MTSFVTKMTPAEVAEQSRIATAQGMREIAAAMSATVRDSDESYYSDSSDSSTETQSKRKKTNVKKQSHDESRANYLKEESRARYLQLELANAAVDLDDAKQEIVKFKALVEPYTAFNNEMAFLKSSIERSNKEISQLTLLQLEKRLCLFKEEYGEHAARCATAVSKVPLAEVGSAFSRVLVVEKRRAFNAEKSLEWSIFVRKTTITVIKSSIISALLVCILAVFYWYFLRNIKMPKLYFNPRLL